MELHVVMASYDRLRALADGRVAVDGAQARVEYSPPASTMRRLRDGEPFDVCEMSLTNYMASRILGSTGYIALPIFPERTIFHANLIVRDDIATPADLHGRRVGLTSFTATAPVWVRTTLERDFGLDPRQVSWFSERAAHASTSTADDVEVHAIAQDDSLGEMLERGELDAVLPSPYPGMSTTINRTDERALLELDGTTRLFRDGLAEAQRYLRTHGFLQANHVVIVREQLVRDNPGLARAVFDAFEAAKRVAYDDLVHLRRSSLLLAQLHVERQRDIFGDDPFPYGVASNVAMLEMLIDIATQQQVLPGTISVEEMFADEVLDT